MGFRISLKCKWKNTAIQKSGNPGSAGSLAHRCPGNLSMSEVCSSWRHSMCGASWKQTATARVRAWETACRSSLLGGHRDSATAGVCHRVFFSVAPDRVDRKIAHLPAPWDLTVEGAGFQVLWWHFSKHWLLTACDSAPAWLIELTLTRLDGFKSEPVNFKKKKKQLWPNIIKREALMVMVLYFAMKRKHCIPHAKHMYLLLFIMKSWTLLAQLLIKYVVF